MQVKDRAAKIIARMKSPEMRTKLVEMRFSIRQKKGVYNDFLCRWKYDEDQLSAASAAIENLIDPAEKDQ